MGRVNSGIKGLDHVLDGGFIKGSVNMISGGTGTGKTTFGLQFIFQGLKMGETCVYISFEEKPADIKEDAASFGWDLGSYEKRGLLKVLYYDPAQVNSLSSALISELESISASRLVLDSISVTGLAIGNPAEVRKLVSNIVNSIKNHSGCTALILSEVGEGSGALSRYGVEEFVADGVILLNYMDSNQNYNRSLMVRKMRRIKHGKDVYPFEIYSNGISLCKRD